MVDALVAALAILLWLVSLVNVVAHLRTHAVTRGWLVGVFALLAVASSLCVSAVTAWTAQVSGLPSLADAIERTAVMGACFCAQSLLGDVRAPHQGQFSWHTGRFRALVIASLVLWSAFLIGNVRGSEVYGSFATRELWPALYMAVFLGYVAYVLGDVMIGCWHYAGSAGGALGVGLRLMAAGCGCALVYAAFKVAALTLAALGPGMPALLQSTIGQAVVVLAGVLVAVGATLPAMVRRGQVARRWWRSYSAHEQLYPLWSALIAVTPGLALEPPSRRIRDRLRVRDMDMRLYRRVIEIRDGRLELRELFAPSVVVASRALASARGLQGRAAEAFVEAKVLESALVAATKGQGVDEPWVGASPQGDSTADEVDWLREVAKQFSPPLSVWHDGTSIRSGVGRVA
jgi:hypothetical protein